MRLATLAARGLPTVEDALPLLPFLGPADGTWERMHAAVRKRVRVRLKRNPQPSAAIVDSQSQRVCGTRAFFSSSASDTGTSSSYRYAPHRSVRAKCN